MTDFAIKKSMLENLSYDEGTMDKNENLVIPTDDQEYENPKLLVIFKGADLSAAAFYLGQSLKNPFAPNAIATVLVQESVRDCFFQTMQTHLVASLTHEIGTSKPRIRALEKIKYLNLAIVTNNPRNVCMSPLLVCDVTHEYMGKKASGIPTVHTFRTAKEAADLANKETIKFDSVSIWNQNHACAYELVAKICCGKFFINCIDAPLEPVEGKMNYATIIKNYHYEIFSLEDDSDDDDDVEDDDEESEEADDDIKIVVFPVGASFAN